MKKKEKVAKSQQRRRDSVHPWEKISLIIQKKKTTKKQEEEMEGRLMLAAAFPVSLAFH
jgi:hypothetical protein